MGNDRQNCDHRLLFRALVAVALSGGAGPPAWAGESAAANPSLDARWTFTAGAAFNSSDAEVASFVKTSGKGGSVDLSRLGVDEDYVSPFLAFRYRPSSRWRWDFAYQNLQLDGNRGATSAIEFGNIVIPVGWNVTTDLSAHIYSATVGYAFYRRHNVELGGMLGLSILDLSADITGSLNAVNAVETRSAGIREVVPVPILALYGTYAFNERWSIDGKVQYLAGGYADYSGELFAASVALNYWVMPNTALTVGYKHFDARVEYDGGSTRDTYDFEFGGPFTTLSIAF